MRREAAEAALRYLRRAEDQLAQAGAVPLHCVNVRTLADIIRAEIEAGAYDAPDSGRN